MLATICSIGSTEDIESGPLSLNAPPAISAGDVSDTLLNPSFSLILNGAGKNVFRLTEVHFYKG